MNDTKQINWKLDETEANYILNTLVERPFKEVSGLVNKLAMQMVPQSEQPQPIDPMDHKTVQIDARQDKAKAK